MLAETTDASITWLGTCCACLTGRERGIQREAECVHEWARPLFQKIWPEPRTSWKHLCNSGLTNNMRSSETELRSGLVGACKIFLSNIYSFMHLVLIITMLFSITTFHISLYLHRMDMHEQWFSLHASLLPVTCLEFCRACFKLRGQCCMNSQSRAHYVISCSPCLSSWQTGWHVEPRRAD